MPLLKDILIRAALVLATVLIIFGTVLSIIALHVFKFFWRLFGRRQKMA